MPHRSRARLARAAVLAALLTAVVPAAPAVAGPEVEAFTAVPIVSAERYHELGGHEYVMAFSPVFEEPATMPPFPEFRRVVLPIERRPGTSPGPITVRATFTAFEFAQDPDYWEAGNSISTTQVPESAIPVADGPGYEGGTIDVPLPAGHGLMTGNLQTVVVRAPGGQPGDLVLGAADSTGQWWHRAKSRPIGGEWTENPTKVFGLRAFVDLNPTAPTVELWPFAGFFSPVNAAPTVNVVNAGSAVPIKFSLGGDRGPDVLAGTPGSQRVSCDPDASTDVLEETAAESQSGLSYDPATDRYAYVWKTSKDQAGTCRRFVLRLADGSSHTALFRMR
jgi:hypothetical protein